MEENVNRKSCTIMLEKTSSSVSNDKVGLNCLKLNN